MTPRATRGEDVAELSALADELLAQATEIRRQWAALSEALGVELEAPDALTVTPQGTIERVAPPSRSSSAAAGDGGFRRATPDRRSEPPAEPHPQPQPQTRSARPPIEDDDTTAVRLVALDMMLSGATREEVGLHLAGTFGETEAVRQALADAFDVDDSGA